MQKNEISSHVYHIPMLFDKFIKGYEQYTMYVEDIIEALRDIDLYDDLVYSICNYMIFDRDVHTIKSTTIVDNLDVYKFIEQHDLAGSLRHGLLSHYCVIDSSVEHGSINVLKYILENITDKIPRPEKIRWIYTAAKLDHVEVFLYLIAYIPTERGRNTIYKKVGANIVRTWNSLNMVKYFHENNIDIDMRDLYRSSNEIISYAILNMNIELGNHQVMCILEKMAERYKYSTCGKHTNIIKHILDKYDHVVSKRLERLMYILLKGSYYDIIHKYIKEYLSSNDKDIPTWICPALCTGKLKYLKLFVSRGLNVHKNNYIFSQCVRDGHINIVDYLINKHNVTVHHRDHGYTMDALRNGRFAMYVYLAEHKAKLQVVQNMKYAIKTGLYEFVEYLCKYKKNLLRSDMDYFKYAIGLEQYSIAQLLFENKIYKNITICSLIYRYHVDILEYLLYVRDNTMDMHQCCTSAKEYANCCNSIRIAMYDMIRYRSHDEHIKLMLKYGVVSPIAYLWTIEHNDIKARKLIESYYLRNFSFNNPIQLKIYEDLMIYIFKDRLMNAYNYIINRICIHKIKVKFLIDNSVVAIKNIVFPDIDGSMVSVNMHINFARGEYIYDEMNTMIDIFNMVD